MTIFQYDRRNDNEICVGDYKLLLIEWNIDANLGQVGRNVIFQGQSDHLVRIDFDFI